MSNIAVIGAGMAGLTAARTLKDNDLQVTIFEKSRGPGGRMATQRIDGLQFDKGAQYFTVKDPRFENFVNPLIQQDMVKEWKLRLGVCIEGKLVARESSIKRYVGVPRMTSLTRYISEDLDIRYQTRIAAINENDNLWFLTDSDENHYGPFTHVILTLPPSQTMDLIYPYRSSFREIENIELAPCWAVMVSFEKSIKIPYDGIFFNGHPISWASRDSSKPQRPKGYTWVLHGSHEWSEKYFNRDNKWIERELIRSFLEAVGERKKIIESFSHRWRYSRAMINVDIGSIFNRDINLAIAGDWLHGSRIEGAYLSGLELAESILKMK